MSIFSRRKTNTDFVEKYVYDIYRNEKNILKERLRDIESKINRLTDHLGFEFKDIPEMKNVLVKKEKKNG